MRESDGEERCGNEFRPVGRRFLARVVGGPFWCRNGGGMSRGGITVGTADVVTQKESVQTG